MDSTSKNEEEPSSQNEPCPEVNQQSLSNEAAASLRTAQESPDHISTLAEDLKCCNWDELLERYASAMEEHSKADEEVRRQTGELYEVRTK